ncbi:MAG TPA: hypothetical protein VM187_15890 [Niastella sp.]|nr:hypothetical protein [Niastella sp.]
MKKLSNLIPWLVTLLLVLWIIFTESPFQKGGVGEVYLIYIAGFVMLIANLIASRYKRSAIPERLVIAIVFAVASLLLVSLYVMPYIIEYQYANKTWYFWETKHRIYINAVFYGLITLDLIISFWGYFKLNFITRKKRTQSPPIPS